MADYGTNAQVQQLAFGATDATQDDRSESARKVATTFINSHLDLAQDLTTPSAGIDNIANLLAAGLILTGQMQVESIREHPFVTLAISLLDKFRGDVSSDGAWRVTIPVDRF
jgi:hypothetical protein